MLTKHCFISCLGSQASKPDVGTAGVETITMPLHDGNDRRGEYSNAFVSLIHKLNKENKAPREVNFEIVV
jgi:hypothetical protein